MTVPYRPTGHAAVSPYLLVSDAAGLVDFLKQAFDGREISRIERTDGTIMHAAVAIDDSVVMVGSRNVTFQNSTHLYVSDVDETYRKCLAFGAESLSEPGTFGYGDRSAGIRDAFGNVWWLGTHMGEKV